VAIIFPVPNFFFGEDADAMFEKFGEGGAAEPDSSGGVVGGIEGVGGDVVTL
jgi:hypothetical protein